MNCKDTIIEEMNRLGKEKTPFLFIIDFLFHKPLVIKLKDVDANKILYNFNGQTNEKQQQKLFTNLNLKYNFNPISFDEYKKQFDLIKKEISLGNSYLLNLTVETPINLNIALKDIFYNTQASYRLWMDDVFVCFSPETFIRIENNTIYSFPMKGTIDGEKPNAQEIILADEKETSEHFTIVDLIRNDLNIVSKNVNVDRFRYIDTINTAKGKLLQVSSQISGKLDNDWQSKIGNILFKLLPAGSISGAPKEKTINIINQTESHSRGYYTGVAGIFNGKYIDSGVLIRYIENRNNKFFYKSGGGITSYSQLNKEYNEIIQKIYVPII